MANRVALTSILYKSNRHSNMVVLQCLTQSKRQKGFFTTKYFDPRVPVGDKPVSRRLSVKDFAAKEYEFEVHVNASFSNGKPQAITSTYVMTSALDWDRFMRFMERYSDANGLGFSKA